MAGLLQVYLAGGKGEIMMSAGKTVDGIMGKGIEYLQGLPAVKLAEVLVTSLARPANATNYEQVGARAPVPKAANLSLLGAKNAKAVLAKFAPDYSRLVDRLISWFDNPATCELAYTAVAGLVKGAKETKNASHKLKA